MVEKEGGRYLITQRPATASLPLLWEFPGGRVEEGETNQEALARELKDEMNIEIEVGDQAIHLQHAYPHYDIEFRVFHCRLKQAGAQIQNLRVRDHRWVTLAEMGSYRFPDADSRTLEKLLELDH